MIRCPKCGAELYWDDQDFEWVCKCGEVYTDAEILAVEGDDAKED